MKQYSFVEFAGRKNNRFQRHIWIKSKAELMQVIKKFDNTDIFTTIQKYKAPASDADYTCNLCFDIDNESLPEQSRKDTISLCDVIATNLGIPQIFLKIRFSGSKGFHVIVDEKIFYPLELEKKNKVWKSIAENYKKYIGSIDMSLYMNTRLFRINNSKHSKTNLYKIPLTYKELKELSIERIKDMAREQRRIEEIPIVRIKSARDKLFSILGKTTDELIFSEPPCIKNIKKGVTKGKRNNALFMLTTYYKNRGLTQDKIFSILWKWNLKNKPRINKHQMGKTLYSVMKGNYSIGCSTADLLEYCDKDNCSIYKRKGDIE